jgi:hypothetical protein
MNEWVKTILAGSIILLPIAALNYYDEPSREFWQGHPEKYRCVYFKECEGGVEAGTDAGSIAAVPSCCCSCSCCPDGGRP